MYVVSSMLTVPIMKRFVGNFGICGVIDAPDGDFLQVNLSSNLPEYRLRHSPDSIHERMSEK